MALPALLFCASLTAADPTFSRLAQEAEAFARELPNLIGEETLSQRAIPRSGGFRIRIGEKAFRDVPAMTEQKEIRSEFAYATFRSKEGEQASIHEVRKLIEVDGKPVSKAEEARRTLVMGIRSGDEELKRKLLGDLEKNLISGAAMDFTLTLLLFRPRSINDYEFTPALHQKIGADDALIYFFKQKSGSASFTVFEGREIRRLPMQGQIWLRVKDGMPLKIRLLSAIEEKDHEPIINDGATEYAVSSHGVVTPVSVVHRQRAGRVVVAENTFTYKQFKRFSTDSGIKFTPLEEDPPKP